MDALLHYIANGPYRLVADLEPPRPSQAHGNVVRSTFLGQCLCLARLLLLGLEILVSIFALQHGLRVKRRPATTKPHGTLLSGMSGCADSPSCRNGRRKKTGSAGHVNGPAGGRAQAQKRCGGCETAPRAAPATQALAGAGSQTSVHPTCLPTLPRERVVPSGSVTRPSTLLQLLHTCAPPPPPSWPKSPLPCARPRGPHRHAVRPRTYVLTLSAFRAQESNRAR